MDNVQEVCYSDINICFKGWFIILILEKSSFPQNLKFIHSSFKSHYTVPVMITVTLILILSIQLFQKLLLNLVKKDAKFLISTEEYRKGFATVIQFGVIQMLQSYKIFKNRTGMSYDSSVSAKSLTTWRTAKFHSLAWVFGFFAPLSIP